MHIIYNCPYNKHDINILPDLLQIMHKFYTNLLIAENNERQPFCGADNP